MDLRLPVKSKNSAAAEIVVVMARVVLWVIFGMTAPMVAPAADLFWDNAIANSGWDTAGNWSTSSTSGDPIFDPAAPPGSADIAFFNIQPLGDAQTVRLNGPQLVAGLIFGETAGAIVIESGSGGPNTLGIGSNGIAVNNGAGTPTIDALISLLAAQSWMNDSSATLTVNGNLSGGSNLLTVGGSGNTTINGALSSGANLNKTGLGQLTITSSNIFGDVALASGSLNVNGDATFEGGSLTRSGGTLNLASSRTLTAQNGAQIDLGGDTRLSGGTTWHINTGADLVGSAALDIGDGIGQTTTVTVDGIGSSLSTGATLSAWGFGGGSANVTIRSGASANVGAIDLARSGTGSVGVINVQSGATIAAGSLRIADSGITSVGTVNVTGTGSTFTQSGASTLTLGGANSGTGTLNIDDGGILTTGTGLFTINSTGTVNIGSRSRLDANGDILVDGGSINRTSGTFQSGHPIYFNPAAGRTVTVQNNGQVNLAGSNVLAGGTTWIFNSGADLISAGGLNLGYTAALNSGTTNLIVDGTGSSLTTGPLVSSIWGGGENRDAHVTIRNGASASVGWRLFLAAPASPPFRGTATIKVESGATMTIGGGLFIAHSGGSGAGTINVTGPGSILTLNEDAFGLALGGSFGSATLNVTNGGTVITNSVGTYISGKGVLNIDGGNVDLKGLSTSFGATVNFTSGSLRYIGGLTVGRFGLFGENLTLNANQELNLSGATMVEPGRSLTIDGGRLGTGSLAIYGNLSQGDGSVVVSNGGAITSAGNLVVDGSLLISSGAVVTSAAGFVGTNHLSRGAATITGTGSTWNSSNLTIGLGVTDSLFTNYLTISDGGLVNVANTLHVLKGGVVSGNGTVAASEVDIQSGAFLSGTLAIQGNVTNGGLISPGFSPEIIHIDGDYTQTSGGELFIEVGGLLPGLEHDQLVITGTATLGGRLSLRLIDGYVPSVNDQITFLTAAGGVTDLFDSLFASNLEQVTDLGVKVLKTATEVNARFVERTDVTFTDPNDADWQQMSSWSTGFVPGTDNIVTVQNNRPIGDQRVEVQTENAYADELAVEDPFAKITIGVHDGLSLSAVARGMTVGNNGVIELGVGAGGVGGTLVGSTIAIEGGGTLTGNGTVDGDLIVGAATGGQDATLSPGFSVGHLDVEGDYQQGSGGMLLVDVEAASQFDTVDVSGSVELGGTLRIDASNLTTISPGTVYPILTAASVEGEFDNVETIGNSAVYFTATYFEGGAGAEAWNRGDMNRDEVINQEDFRLFVLGLMDPSRYFDECNCDDFGQAGGDFSLNGRLDFDDVAGFEASLNGSGTSSAGLTAAFDDYFNHVPEPSSVMLLLCGASPLIHCRPRWFLSIRRVECLCVARDNMS